jgi:glycosyltransferase involved in cell wall biosynthesis
LIVEEFQQRYRNLVYLRTEIRETLYAAWNRAIKIARGRYLTNANTDDRHAPDALEKLARALDDHPDVGVAYATTAITETENTTLAQGPVTGCFRARAFDRRRLFRDCLPGPQPMWRRELHERFGYFDESLFSAGDYEFWLRLSAEVRFLHLPEVLGLFLKSPDSLMHRNAERAAREAELARDRYWPREWGRRTPNSQYWLDRLTRRSTYKEFGRTVMKLLGSRARD